MTGGYSRILRKFGAENKSFFLFSTQKRLQDLGITDAALDKGQARPPIITIADESPIFGGSILRPVMKGSQQWETKKFRCICSNVLVCLRPRSTK